MQNFKLDEAIVSENDCQTCDSRMSEIEIEHVTRQWYSCRKCFMREWETSAQKHLSSIYRNINVNQCNGIHSCGHVAFSVWFLFQKQMSTTCRTKRTPYWWESNRQLKHWKVIACKNNPHLFSIEFKLLIAFSRKLCKPRKCVNNYEMHKFDENIFICFEV